MPLLLNTKLTPRDEALGCELHLSKNINGNELQNLASHSSLYEFAKKGVSGHETSVFFVDLDVVHGQYLKWFKLLPRVKPFYGRIIICYIFLLSYYIHFYE